MRINNVKSKNSFNDVKIWLNEIREKAPRSALVFLIGNKLDLEDQRQVSTEEGFAYAQANGTFYLIILISSYFSIFCYSIYINLF